MPHGAGHIGGDHYGGGGFHHHHGGFHYHRHHGHHHHRGSWWWWFGGAGPYSPYGYGYRRHGAFWLIFILVVIVIAVLVSVSLGLRYGTHAEDNDKTREYALTDKVIHTYNSDFCQGLQAKSTSYAAQSSATLYLLNEYPPLTDEESFNLFKTVEFTSEGDYYNWNFYLNVGSSINFSACYKSDASFYYNYGITLYVIRGTQNFNKWKDDPRSFNSYCSISSPCTNDISYSVLKSDRYYFVFYSSGYTQQWLDISSHISRTVFHISPENIVQDCTIPLDNYSSCSVGVPLSFGYTALLSLNTSKSTDSYNDDGADINISCEPRIWLYAVIVLSAILPVIIVLTIVIVCVCVIVKRKKKKYAPLVGSDYQTAKDAFDDSGNINVPTRPSIVVESGSGPTPTTKPSRTVGYGTTSTPPVCTT